MYITTTPVRNRPSLLNLNTDIELFSKKPTDKRLNYENTKCWTLLGCPWSWLVGYLVRTEANNVIFGMELFVPAWLVTAWPWKWMFHTSPKRRYLFTKRQGVISLKIWIFDFSPHQAPVGSNVMTQRVSFNTANCSKRFKRTAQSSLALTYDVTRQPTLPCS